jgi:vacuolar-type H+-ATPase subunit H
MVQENVQSTTDILQEIHAAETQAAEIKRNAAEQAARLYADAQAQAAHSEETNAEVCKAYVDTQIKAARAQAEKNYEETVNAKRKEAQAYCAKALENAETLVNDIVGRIIRGNR